jgi:mono/diheme cytochrome c family protein
MRSRVVVAAFILTAVSWATPAFAQGSVERGMKVYAAQKCAMCHSLAGKGNVKGPLDEALSKLSNDEIRQWLVNPVEMREKAHAERKPVMKSFSTLSKDDLDALVAYLSSLKKK